MTRPGTIADADPLVRIRPHLLGHAAVTSALGGTGRVGKKNEPPYPRIRLSIPPGGRGSVLWLQQPLVRLEALGDLDGRPGSEELRRILFVAVAAVAELPWLPAEAGEPVITDVGWAGGGDVPEPKTGQPRWLADLATAVTPPAVVLL